MDHRVMGLPHGTSAPLPESILSSAQGHGFKPGDRVLHDEYGLGVVTEAVEEPVGLSLWKVETSRGNSERRMMLHPIAVKQDGGRVPAVERQCDAYLRAPTADPVWSPEQRTTLFREVVEPELQRDLRKKGVVNEKGGYTATLIGYVEIAKK